MEKGRLTRAPSITKVPPREALRGRVDEAIMVHHHGLTFRFGGAPLGRAVRSCAQISTTTMTTKTSRRAAEVM